MNEQILTFLPVLAIIIPMVSGISMAFVRADDRRTRNYQTLITVAITSVLVLIINVSGHENTFLFFDFGSKMSIAVRVDGLGRLFSSIAALLWPLATVFAIEYMKNRGDEKRFFCFYTVTYGVTLAIAYSANFLTMYLFYELLTLMTLPLVIHNMNKEAFAAGRKYIWYSIGGAGLIFICLVFIVSYGDTLDFRMGGVFSGAILADYGELVLQAFVVAFIGLGVKAALFPVHGWLISASVAPTVVTALLHAVAVVKAGSFAIMRLTFYLFGADILLGTWAQYFVMGLTLLTILYGSCRALYTSHLKRRLAYSTVSQLSYINFGVTLMTPNGFAAAMMFLLAHSLIKILLFFCSGTVTFITHKYEIADMRGLGRQMPVTFVIFSVAALALMGVPPASGFISKLQLLTATAQAGGSMAYTGFIIITISILLTAAYMFSVVRTVYFPESGSAPVDKEHAPRDPGLAMTIPLAVLAFLVVFLGLIARPLQAWFLQIATG